MTARTREGKTEGVVPSVSLNRLKGMIKAKMMENGHHHQDHPQLTIKEAAIQVNLPPLLKAEIEDIVIKGSGSNRRKIAVAIMIIEEGTNHEGAGAAVTRTVQGMNKTMISEDITKDGAEAHHLHRHPIPGKIIIGMIALDEARLLKTIGHLKNEDRRSFAGIPNSLTYNELLL